MLPESNATSKSLTPKLIDLAILSSNENQVYQAGGLDTGRAMVSTSLLRSGAWLAFALIAGSSAPALAANCKSSGGLAYLGNTRNDTKSVWLSRTDQGSFALEAAQGSQTVDSWGFRPRAACISQPHPWCPTATGARTNCSRQVTASPA
jgi:hypothetical protein